MLEQSWREEAEVEVDRMRKELMERSGREEEEERRAKEVEADRMVELRRKLALQGSRRDGVETEMDRMQRELVERSGIEEEDAERRAKEAEADRMRKEAVERCAPSSRGRFPCSFWRAPLPPSTSPERACVLFLLLIRPQVRMGPTLQNGMI